MTSHSFQLAIKIYKYLGYV